MAFKERWPLRPPTKHEMKVGTSREGVNIPRNKYRKKGWKEEYLANWLIFLAEEEKQSDQGKSI